jgi:hypothetical protein
MGERTMNDTKSDTKLITVTTDNLDVFVNPHDMRKDLHTFIDYICRREVKRAHRDNSLSKSDLQRLAKLMPDRQQRPSHGCGKLMSWH